MEKKSKLGLWIILIILIIAVGGLSWYAGVKYTENKYKDDDKVENTKTKKKKTENVPEEEAKLKDEMVPDTYNIVELSKHGSLYEGENDLFDDEGYIKDSYYNIEELKDKKFISYFDIVENDVGGDPYYFFSTDGKLYKFSSFCNTIDYREEEEEEDCVTQIKTPKKLDNVKAYSYFSNELSSSNLLLFSGNEVYDLGWNKFDTSHYPVLYDGSEQGTMVGYNDGTLMYSEEDRRDVKLIDPETNEEVHFKYVITIGPYDLRSYYLIGENNYLYHYQPGEGDPASYGFHKMKKIVDINLGDSYVNDGITYDCGDSICDMTVKEENGITFHFYA